MVTRGSRYANLGILWAAYAVFMIAAAAWIFLYSQTLTLMWGAIINRVADPFAWMGLFHFLLAATIVMALISAVLSLLAAIALMQGAASSRSMGLAAAAFGLLGPPLGTMLGAFTIAILFPLRTENTSAA
jgi:hypothetical protein